MSLPRPDLRSHARVTLGPGQDITVEPSWKEKARLAARLTIDATGAQSLGGHLEIRSDVAVGQGLGSSTSDVVAAIRATLAALQTGLQPVHIARLAVAAEQASDAVMFNHRCVLLEHRDGIVLEDFRRALPAMTVVGFPTRGPEHVVLTLDLPLPSYVDAEIERFDNLRQKLREGITRGSLARIGEVTTESARINQRFLPIEDLDLFLAIAAESGAHGLQVAHSGTVAGLLFAPADGPGPVERARQLLGEAGVPRTYQFRLAAR